MNDSICTSLTLKLFRTKKDATYAHMLYKVKKFNIKWLSTHLDNFNPNRLQKSAKDAYPINNRPRGLKDLKSVYFWRQQIRDNNRVSIWILKKNKKYILLDGAHRIVAHYLEHKKSITAYIVTKRVL
jgi:hypothetical protein